MVPGSLDIKMVNEPAIVLGWVELGWEVLFCTTDHF